MLPSLLSLGAGGPAPSLPRRRRCGGPRAAIVDPQGAAVVQMSSAATVEGLRLAVGGRAMQERGGAAWPSSTPTSSPTDRTEPHSTTCATATRPTERRCSSVHRRTPQGAIRRLPTGAGPPPHRPAMVSRVSRPSVMGSSENFTMCFVHAYNGLH
jgi:hypothetical protein